MGYQIGPCALYYRLYSNSSGALASLGDTFGGVNLTVEESFKTINTDQAGTVPVDEFITGMTPKISAKLANITLENLAFMLKGTIETSDTHKRLLLTAHAGYSLMTNAIYLQLRPYVNGAESTDENDWITLPKAGIKATANLVYDNETQRVIQFDATGYPDASRSNAVIILGNVTLT